MNFTFWIIVVWLVISLEMRMFDRKRNDAKTKGFCKANRRQVIDAVYDSVPTGYCPSCGPRMNWED